MSDLRDRIAKVLLPDLEYAYSYNPGPQSPEDWANKLADAVIAALNLTTPVEYLSVDGSRQNYRVAGHYTEDVNDETD